MPPFLSGNGKDGVVRRALGWHNDAKLQPLSNVLLHFSPMGIWDLELLEVNWLFGFEGNLLE
jgi:hypothetical protein